MIPALILSATLIVLAVAGWAALRPTQLRKRLRSRVVVTLKSGASFEGVLYATDARTWVLRDAQALAAGDQGANVPVDGEVMVMVADVEFCQRP